ncbi:lycopene cyclase domain-containing protein [Flaviflexus equikiangi]|uniref:Lycopene cyclase domain-containing protein n=1 Tax=Flaviflexus equikiangi TaxID=2758573 RepID=A0ABS2TEH6_9ACTO|nr:lycopene cyclase domain-containing protein [Flaviflexus equikiangi]MBM9433056.1 lycopene cyclase domain-containing protein [Flaviflexus equikiangi]
MTYALLAALFVLACGAVAVVVSVTHGLGARWWTVTGLTIVILCVLTIVFDSLMILSDLFRYDDSVLLGIRLWHAPIEDLAWPVAAGLLLPSLAVLTAQKGTR